MGYNEKYKSKRLKRKVIGIFKSIFTLIYTCSTAIVPMYVLYYTFSLKNSFLYAIAISGISFVAMDIVCSILEDAIERTLKIVLNANKKRQRKREKLQEENQDVIKRLEELVKERNDYNIEMDRIVKECKELKQEVLQVEEKLPNRLKEGFINICKQIDDIINMVKQEPQQYYEIRHTFTGHFSEFQEVTYKLINLLKEDSIAEETIFEFIELITKFKQHLEVVKSSINATHEQMLNIEVRSLINVLETERKKGDS